MKTKPSVRDVVLFTYKAFDGRITGKTLLQKRVYFMSVFLNVDLGYDAHYYGPYSEEVATSNIEMKSLGFISESVMNWGIDHQGFEMVRYDYSLTNAGFSLADKKAERSPDLWSKIYEVSKLIKNAGDLDYMELSIAAKAYHVLIKLNGKATLEDVSAMLPNFGWVVNERDLERATKFLEKVDLIAIQH